MEQFHNRSRFRSLETNRNVRQKHRPRNDTRELWESNKVYPWYVSLSASVKHIDLFLKYKPETAKAIYVLPFISRGSMMVTCTESRDFLDIVSSFFNSCSNLHRTDFVFTVCFKFIVFTFCIKFRTPGMRNGNVFHYHQDTLNMSLALLSLHKHYHCYGPFTHYCASISGWEILAQV